MSAVNEQLSVYYLDRGANSRHAALGSVDFGSAQLPFTSLFPNHLLLCSLQNFLPICLLLSHVFLVQVSLHSLIIWTTFIPTLPPHSRCLSLSIEKPSQRTTVLLRYLIPFIDVDYCSSKHDEQAYEIAAILDVEP